MSFSMAPATNDPFRNVLALGNMGVFLLERGFYEEAMMTLKDAVSSLSTGVARKKRGETVDSSTRYSLLHQKSLRRAAKTITKSTKRLSMHIQPISHFTDLWSAVDQVSHEGPGCRMLYPIRFDEPDFDAINEQSYDLESAVLLYNFAISYVCLSTTTKSSASKEKLQKGAKKIFLAAQSILHARCELCDDDLRLSQMLFIEFLLLNNLTQLFQETNEGDAARTCYSDLVDLRHVILELQMDHSHLKSTSVIAAAA